MKGTMCGIYKSQAGPSVEYRTDLPIPEINDDEVLIKVRAASICGTDIGVINWNEWTQKRMTPPLVIGHEVAGDIVEIGKNVTNCKVGDRVSVETHIPCRNCYLCDIGMEEVCDNTKLFSIHTLGGFAEYTKMRSDCVFKLDDDITYEMACMFEPMGAGINGVSRAEVKDKYVLISGCGPIGLTAISAAKIYGAKKVIACDVVDEKLEVAKKMGADVVINSGKSDLIEEVKKETEGRGADAAIDLTGNGRAIISSLRSLRKGGRLVLVGLPSGEVSINLTEDLIYRAIEVIGISGRKIFKTWHEYAAVMKDPRYDISLVMGNEYPLADYEKALEDIKNGVPGKMILHP